MAAMAAAIVAAVMVAAVMETLVMVDVPLDGSPADRRGVRPENEPEVGEEAEVAPAMAGPVEGAPGTGVPAAVVVSPEAAPVLAADGPMGIVFPSTERMVTDVHGVRTIVETVGSSEVIPNRTVSVIDRSGRVNGSALRIVSLNDAVPAMNAVSHRHAPAMEPELVGPIATIALRRSCSRKPQLQPHRLMT